MRNLINIIEDKQLKKEIIGVVNATDDFTVLQRVLNVLKAGNIDERIKSVIGKDGDAQYFLKQIVKAILDIEAPIEEKNEFLTRYEKGTVIVSSKLLDSKLHSFADLVGNGFTLELFKQLSVDLTSQGVGPGEVALAVLSPDIQWSGRISGGGDIIVNKKAVEVKTRVKEGGRWINARKAKLDLTGIQSAMTSHLLTPVEIPDRVNTTTWADTIRPAIDPKKLKEVVKKIADSTFKFVDNTQYQTALISGDAAAIVNAYLNVGYDNYKKYSGFEGMLLMDVPTEQIQYFHDYEDMNGSISTGTCYIMAPESEMMPQVILDPGAGPIRVGRLGKTVVPDAKPEATSSQYQKEITDFAETLAAKHKASYPHVIGKIVHMTTDALQQGVPGKDILAMLKAEIPELTSAPTNIAKDPKVDVAKLGGTKPVSDDGWSDPVKPATESAIFGRQRRA